MNATAERIHVRSCECPVEGCKCTRQTTEDSCAPCAAGTHADEDCRTLCSSTICRRNTVVATRRVTYRGQTRPFCAFCATGWQRNGAEVEKIA